jgi:molybdenum cofactor biosynthesis enzyme MoaA
MKNWSPNDNQTFVLKTNGLLIKKQLENLRILNNITHYSISVDAGTKEIYEDVRRPGRWELLIENFDFLQSIDKNKITTLNFALQNKNYRDIESFIELCRAYQFHGHIHEITNWGTWSQIDPKEHADSWTIKNGIFLDHDVLNKNHPNYSEVKQIILKHQHHEYINFSSNVIQQIS